MTKRKKPGATSEEELSYLPGLPSPPPVYSKLCVKSFNYMTLCFF